MTQVRSGIVRRYDPDVHAATIEVEHGALREGDRILIVGHGHQLIEPARGLEVQHHEVVEAGPGDTVEVRVDFPVDEADEVYVVRREGAQRRKGARPPMSWWDIR